ncbi:MAG: DUF3990 domain-containing protein [Chitinispirillia bacterium]|nr:DUF3990 domain-containing protein [Chitinispirillia bacterium]
MILYHGSNCAVESANLDKCKPFKDFGQGFYTTEIKEQALIMAKRTARLFGGNPVLSEFSLDENIFSDEKIHIKTFAEPSIEWATFVLNNRNRKFNTISDPNCNRDNKYDVVTGPVANDDIRLTIELYVDGRLSPAGLLDALRYRDLSQQISFHTEKSLSFLTRIS